ncbi:hypothetical protein GGI07_005282 [Coemansia sp. Benny D115]|nr:hypothetical protein GGI07_005282 [Coemansia sp. Benny D115]
MITTSSATTIDASATVPLGSSLSVTYKQLPATNSTYVYENDGMVVYPEHRSSGIGGNSTKYNPSGIGMHIKERKDMGIGKACLTAPMSRSNNNSRTSSMVRGSSHHGNHENHGNHGTEKLTDQIKRVLSFTSLRSLTPSSRPGSILGSEDESATQKNE